MILLKQVLTSYLVASDFWFSQAWRLNNFPRIYSLLFAGCRYPWRFFLGSGPGSASHCLAGYAVSRLFTCGPVYLFCFAYALLASFCAGSRSRGVAKSGAVTKSSVVAESHVVAENHVVAETRVVAKSRVVAKTSA